MATAPPTPASNTRPANQPLRIPPEETVWKRYSPHGEAPLSFVGSAATHLLVIMALALFGFLAYMFFNPPLPDLPVDVVRMPGGGGGNPKGQGAGPGIGTGAREDVPSGDDKSSSDVLDPDQIQRPPLTIDEAKSFNPEFKNDPAAVRFIESGNENFKKIARLNQDIRDKLRDGVNPGKGQGGTGQGGGKGNGNGTGTGSGDGPGNQQLSTREKRMLRWSMSFNRSTYLEQLRDLGAIIAVPVGRDGKRYQTCDLTKQPLRWVDDDLSKNTRIFWIDDKPDSVRALMTQMGRPGYTAHFVALLPEKVEKELFEKERSYKGLAEDDIFETKFECVVGANGRYDVVVKSQTAK